MPERIHRRLRPRAVLRFGGVLALVAGGVLLFRALPGTLARIPLFDVATVRVEGTVLLEDREILDVVAIPDSASVWDDPTSWEARVASHPMVRTVQVRRRLPSTLIVDVEEREAVAFVATPVLEPVDAEGRLLPVDPSRVRLDLPVVRLRKGAADEEGRPPPHRLRGPVEAVVRLRQNPAFHGRLSELREEADGTVTAFWGSSPSLEIFMRLPIDPALVDEGLEVLAWALAQDSTQTPRYIDLRWAEQVVVGYGTE